MDEKIQEALEKFAEESVKEYTQEETKEILTKIEEVEQKILDLTSSEVYKVIDKKHITLIREPIKKTNVILKNVNFQYAMKLWNYLRP